MIHARSKARNIGASIFKLNFATPVELENETGVNMSVSFTLFSPKTNMKAAMKRQNDVIVNEAPIFVSTLLKNLPLCSAMLLN